MDFPASPAGAIVAVSLPWTNTADGAHLIQVVADPGFVQYAGNDRATRLIFVGATPDAFQIDKTVALLDADRNGTPTPGDTLAYTVSYANVGDADLTGAVLLDGYDELLLQTPFDISDAGTVADGSIVWDLGTLAAHASGTVTHEVRIKPVAEFPPGVVSVVNTALLDTLQTAPVAAQAQIDVLGDLRLRFDFDGYHGYTADGWTSVSPFQLKAGHAFGWQTRPPQYFEREHPDAPPYDSDDGELKYDGQATDSLGTPLTFLVDVAAGRTYEVMVLTGDTVWNHDRQQFTATGSGTDGSTAWTQVDTWGAGAPSDDAANAIWGGGTANPGAGYYRWVRLTVDVGGAPGTVGQIAVRMEDLGGVDGAAVILGMDIRPVEAVGQITLTPLTALSADGVTWDTYSGSDAPPHAVLTVTGFAPDTDPTSADNAH